VAGVVDLAGEGGGREEVAEVEEVAGAADRPARRKKRRSLSRHCAGAVMPWTPELHHCRPHRHARRSELPQSSRPELAYHRTTDPVGGLLATVVRPRCAGRERWSRDGRGGSGGRGGGERSAGRGRRVAAKWEEWGC
jgi:hypothetical protein